MNIQYYILCVVCLFFYLYFFVVLVLLMLLFSSSYSLYIYILKIKNDCGVEFILTEIISNVIFVNV